jgi:pectin methylesterase-like acyl-CoA thioesterase
VAAALALASCGGSDADDGTGGGPAGGSSAAGSPGKAGDGGGGRGGMNGVAGTGGDPSQTGGGRAGTGGVAGEASAGQGGVAGTGGGAGQAGAGGAPGGGGRAAAGRGGGGGTTSGGAGGATAAGGAGGGSVALPPGVTALFPPPGGQAICPDPTLRITFATPPTLGTTGKVQVWSAAGAAVASVDMATAKVTDTIGGTTFVLLRPAYVDGNTAVVYLKTKALGYGQSYYVTVDAGAIRPPGGGTFAITGTTAWRFTTAPAAPASLGALTVALDGGGQFCTIQGATDALPANNSAAARITIANGRYHEIVHVSKKSNITLHGESRAGTIIEGTNNNTQQEGNSPGTATRALLGFDGTNGLVIENLTIHNLTPQDGSQAEALRLQTCDKCIVRNADILSLQDTLLWSGRIYAENCLIAGNVDYVWGTGVAFFNKCELRTVGRSGVIVQARNGTGAYGYVFVDCKLTTDSASKNNILARIDVSVYPGSHVAYVNCQMTNVAAAGWTITGGGATSSLRFWEYQSTDDAGRALSVSGRTGGTQISASQAAMMRDPTVVLGGWQP